MQIRCYACHMPFSLNKATVHGALDQVYTEDLSHFNAVCPRCRKANRISKQQLQRAAPDWIPPEQRIEPAAPAEAEEAEASAKSEELES